MFLNCVSYKIYIQMKSKGVAHSESCDIITLTSQWNEWLWLLYFRTVSVFDSASQIIVFLDLTGRAQWCCLVCMTEFSIT